MPRRTKTLVALIVEAGNEKFTIPLTKGKKATMEAVCLMVESLTGYNAEFFKKHEVKQ